MFKNADPDFEIRRNIALASIAGIFIICITCFGVVFFGNEGAATRMNSVSGILQTIVLALVANFAHYCDQVYRKDKIKETKDEPTTD